MDSVTPLLKTSYGLGSVRATTLSLWSRKKYQYLRRIHTSSFRGYGGGQAYAGMTLINDCFIYGWPRQSLTREINLSIPSENFHTIFAVLTPDKLYVPCEASGGNSQNNLLDGMDFPKLRQRSHPTRTIAPGMGRVIDGDRNNTLVTGGFILAEDGTVTHWGRKVTNPVVQIYDRSIYNRGVWAIQHARKLLDIYIHRHKLLENSGNYYWDRDWTADKLWQVLRLVWHKEMVSHEDFRAIWAGRIKIPTYEALRTMWMREGVRLGFCRLVPSDVPLYNEASLQDVQNQELTLDEVILAPHR